MKVAIEKYLREQTIEKGFLAANEYEAKAGAYTRRALKDTEESLAAFKEKRKPAYLGK